MKINQSLLVHLSFPAAVALAALVFAGCQSAPQKPAAQPMAAAAPEVQTSSAPAVENNAMLPTIRIDAGATDGYTDNRGHKWLPDQGFADGDTIERPDLTITNAVDQHIYLSEHYGMTKFTQPLPNGNYIVKLHFCETFEGISGPDQRIFSFNVAGHAFNNFDVWAKAGGPQRACVVTVPVTIAKGMLEITFTPDVENPQINGIEIIPASP